MQGFAAHLITFLQQFNKTGTLILDSIYHITLQIILKSRFWHENIQGFAVNICNIAMGIIS